MEKDLSTEEMGSERPASPVEADQGIFVDPVIEKRALRKFDMVMMPQIVILVIISMLDRSNIGNARVFGLEEGLNMGGDDFNNVSTLFYPTYILCDIPWVVALRRYGVNKVLCIAMTGWSVITLGTGFVQNYEQILACRVLLGIFESALIPCLVFTISTIWSRNNQAKRVSVIYIGSGISGAFGGLIAYAVQSMGTRYGIEAWRWLFIVEGIISIVLCGAAWLTMPTTAERAWFLTAEEKAVMEARKQRDSHFKGPDSEFKLAHLKAAVSDPFIWLGSLTLFANTTAILGFAVFLPTIIAGMGYTNLEANYLTIPVYIVSALCSYVCAFSADKLKSRAILLFFLPLPGIVGYAMITGSGNKAVGYAAMFLCGGGLFSLSTILLTWITINISPDYKRSVGVGLMCMLANCSGVLASQIYQTKDAPRYVPGNAISMGMEVVVCVGVILMYIMLRVRNAKKEKMRAEGVTANKGLGDQSLEFEYYL